MLGRAGFEVIDTKRPLAPWGKCCRVCRGAGGEDLTQYEQFTIENMHGIFRHTGTHLLSLGKLEGPGGEKINTGDGLEAALQQVEGGMKEGEAASLLIYCVAVKN